MIDYCVVLKCANKCITGDQSKLIRETYVLHIHDFTFKTTLGQQLAPCYHFHAILTCPATSLSPEAVCMGCPGARRPISL